jgi:hypothetical protein
VILRSMLEACYKKNISMDRGKPQQMEMTVEIKSILKCAI